MTTCATAVRPTHETDPGEQSRYQVRQFPTCQSVSSDQKRSQTLALPPTGTPPSFRLSLVRQAVIFIPSAVQYALSTSGTALASTMITAASFEGGSSTRSAPGIADCAGAKSLGGRSTTRRVVRGGPRVHPKEVPSALLKAGSATSGSGEGVDPLPVRRRLIPPPAVLVTPRQLRWSRSSSRDQGPRRSCRASTRDNRGPKSARRRHGRAQRAERSRSHGGRG